MKPLYTVMLLLMYPSAACFVSYGVYGLGRWVGMSEFVAFAAGLVVLAGWYVGWLFMLDKTKED